ncbi:MAG: hypothetical protein GEV07_29155 [Streptosporangiales bacterium]|nr:hypothetical protein [Streptosporangiales bacterium]
MTSTTGRPNRVALAIAYAAGTALAGYGVWLMLTTRTSRKLFDVFLWLAGALVVHDGIIAPLAVVVGLVVARFVPAMVRAPVQAGLFASGAVTVAAASLVLGLGRKPDNPSLLPLPYGRNLLLVLALIWATVAVLAGVKRIFRRTDEFADREESVPPTRRERTSEEA